MIDAATDAETAEVQRYLQGVDDKAAALNELGNWLRARGRSAEAVRWYRMAIESAPDRAPLHANLAAASIDLRQFTDARRLLEHALVLDPRLTIARSNLATTLRALGEDSDALGEFRRVAIEEPRFLYARVHALTLARELADWTNWDDEMRTLGAIDATPGNTAPQLDLLYLPLDPRQLRAHAEAYATECWGEPSTRTALRERSRRRSGGRVRIGYVSDELRRHATGTLLAEVLELHDRKAFDVHVYSWGADDGSVTERRVRRCSSVCDISKLSDLAAADRVRADRIDILVDLKGHLPQSRTGLFALRPAPIQVSWLGFPGTLGTRFHDYLIADDVVVPPGAEHAYTEHLARLPNCYQPNDRKRPMAAPRARAAYGLADDAFVFCHLGKSSKILPDVFGNWMELLRSVPAGVLWLLAERESVRAAFREKARLAGVDPQRLIFTGPVAVDEHVARFALADLALDTFPYGSHTTASEALWAGCPLVTRIGATFASRVAASLLRAAGLPDLVTDTPAGYRELAESLARDSERLGAVRRRVIEARNDSGLFDTPRFVRDLELLYTRMFARLQSGQAPAALDARPGALT